MPIHISHCSLYRRTAAANSSLAMLCTTPSQVVLNLSWHKEMPVRAEFILGNRKEPTKARSSNYDEWLIVLRPFSLRKSWTEVAVGTGTLSLRFRRVLGFHSGSVLMKNLHETCQGFKVACGIDCVTPGDVVRIDGVGGIEEDENHLLCPGGRDSGLY
jgi:hypothetical protein